MNGLVEWATSAKTDSFTADLATGEVEFGKGYPEGTWAVKGEVGVEDWS
jgi:hypothetical protein